MPDTATLSLLLSSLALIVTIISFVWNRNHTNKVFEASQLPLLDVSLKPIVYSQNFHRSYLHYDVVHFTSGRIEIMKVKLKVEIATPTRYWIFGLRRYALFFDKDIESALLKPTPSEIKTQSPSLEDFIADKWPYSVKFRDWPHYVSDQRFITFAKKLRVRITLLYTPATYGHSQRKIVKHYVLQQTFFPEDPINTIRWTIQ